MASYQDETSASVTHKECSVISHLISDIKRVESGACIHSIHVDAPQTRGSYDLCIPLPNLCYSAEELPNVVQGVSTCTPIIELQLTFVSSPAGTLINNNICEISYDLVIQNGMIRCTRSRNQLLGRSIE